MYRPRRIPRQFSRYTDEKDIRREIQEIRDRIESNTRMNLDIQSNVTNEIDDLRQENMKMAAMLNRKEIFHGHTNIYEEVTRLRCMNLRLKAITDLQGTNLHITTYKNPSLVVKTDTSCKETTKQRNSQCSSGRLTCTGIDPSSSGRLTCTGIDPSSSGRLTCTRIDPSSSGRLTCTGIDPSSSGRLTCTRIDPSSSGRLTCTGIDPSSSGRLTCTGIDPSIPRSVDAIIQSSDENSIMNSAGLSFIEGMLCTIYSTKKVSGGTESYDHTKDVTILDLCGCSDKRNIRFFVRSAPPLPKIDVHQHLTVTAEDVAIREFLSFDDENLREATLDIPAELTLPGQGITPTTAPRMSASY